MESPQVIVLKMIARLFKEFPDLSFMAEFMPNYAMVHTQFSDKSSGFVFFVVPENQDTPSNQTVPFLLAAQEYLEGTGFKVVGLRKTDEVGPFDVAYLFAFYLRIHGFNVQEMREEDQDHPAEIFVITPDGEPWYVAFTHGTIEVYPGDIDPKSPVTIMARSFLEFLGLNEGTVSLTASLPE